mgnify:CR=1 FL=1
MCSSDLISTSSTMTFEQLAEKWLEHGKNVRRLSESCLINYRAHLKNHVFPLFGSTPVSKLTIDDIENLAREINHKVPKTRSYTALRKNLWNYGNGDGEVLSLSYQKEILTVACMVMTWASKRRPALVQENPFEFFKLPDSPEQLYD